VAIGLVIIGIIILLVSTGGYFGLNYHRILMGINEIILLMAIGGYWYHRRLLVILLQTISDYLISGY
jgi:hypothetical protein